MRLSRYYMPTLKETPGEAQIASHRLMLRAGMIRQEAAGIYAWLPLGLKVLAKIEKIVCEEQDRAGAVRMLMPTIQPASLWEESGRYDAYGPEMLRIRDRQDREMLYGPTNEEMITEIARAGVQSYKQLPILLYHVQWKFRDEIRPRFGVMRGREFLMKDAYSFDVDEAGARASYLKMYAAYLRTFDRLGLKSVPTRAATGPIGGELSHEFIILAETGESEVFVHKDLVDMPVPPASLDFDGDLEPLFAERAGLYAATDEMHDEAEWAKVPEGDRLQARGIEVGHIFSFGTKYSDAMGLKVQDKDGRERALEMGSYGIGVSRLAGALIEAHHDEAGIAWPVPVAPFHCGLVNLKAGDADTDAACERLYSALLGQET
jgi:prolyl-tRNA synthetase